MPETSNPSPPSPTPAPAAKPEVEPKTEKLREISLPAAVLALDLDASGGIAFAACQDGAIHRVDLESGESKEIGRHESYASGIVRLPDGLTLVSAGYDGRLIWHDIVERRPIRVVQAHAFWSWDLALSADGRLLASTTGRYEAGGYKYEPAAEREPSVKVYDARTGELRLSLAHVPPVQAVAISPDGRHVAAGNLMGEIRVWETTGGRQVAGWTTSDLTSWGVIKSHHYLGGVFAMTFAPGGEELFVCGMGPMVDPMAGNGVQRWQRFAWRDGKKLGQTLDGESGQGLMEALAFHPSGRWFAMAGRLFQGQWNLALFDATTGARRHAVDAKHRITDAMFGPGGERLVIAKAKAQERRKDGTWAPYGLVEVHRVTGLG